MIRASPPTPDKNNVPAAHVTLTAIPLLGLDKENEVNVSLKQIHHLLTPRLQKRFLEKVTITKAYFGEGL